MFLVISQPLFFQVWKLLNVDQTSLACLAAVLLALVCFQYQFFNELPLVGHIPARYRAKHMFC